MTSREHKPDGVPLNTVSIDTNLSNLRMRKGKPGRKDGTQSHGSKARTAKIAGLPKLREAEGVTMMRVLSANQRLHHRQPATSRRVVSYRYAAWSKAVSTSVLALFTGMALCRIPAHASRLSGKADLFLIQKAARHETQGWTAVIARFNGDLTPAQEARMKALHADVYRHLPIIHSVAVRIPTRNLEALASLPFVQHLSADSVVRQIDAFQPASQATE